MTIENCKVIKQKTSLPNPRYPNTKPKKINVKDIGNPGLAKSAQTVGEYARYGTSLSKGLSELAIITTGRVWSSAFEWEHHAPLAIEGGIDPHHVEIISQGKRPNFNKLEEEAVFDFAAEANILKNVSDNTYNNLVSILDETAAIDIVGICGYYSLISMTLNVFKVPNDTDKWPLPEVKHFSKMLKSQLLLGNVY